MKTFLSFLLILPLITACASGPSKRQLDDEVRQLCEKDGGIKVYETVKLPAHKFEKSGYIYIPSKRKAKPDDEYYYESFKYYIKKGNPEMWQSNYKVYRQSDQSLLGEVILYIRRGGDIPGPWHDTSFMCPEDAGLNNLSKKISIQK